MIREIRPADTPRVLEFLRNYFPEEEKILGTRPEGFAEIVRRVFRWDARLVTGFLRLVGRPIFRFFVVEADGRIVATTLLTFPPRAGYISMVAVDQGYRRRGLARMLLERARSATAARGRPYLALDVLAANAPARALYESLGYRPLRSASYLVHDDPRAFGRGPGPVPGLRPFRREDAPALAEIAQTSAPAEIEQVLPTSARDIAGSAWVARMLASESAAWVLDDGAGPVAWVAAVSSRATEAAHVSAPIIGPDVKEESAAALVRTAGAWCGGRGAPRLAATLPEENRRGRTALEEAGFHDVLPIWTLYRRVA